MMQLMQRAFRFGQTLIDIKAHPVPNLHQPIDTKVLFESELPQSDISTIFQHAEPIGLSAGYSQQGTLLALCIADKSSCRVIEFEYPHGSRRNQLQDLSEQRKSTKKLLETHILCRAAGESFAFDMGKIVAALYRDLGLHVINAVDLQTGLSPGDRNVVTCVKAVVGDSMKINEDNIEHVFSGSIYADTNKNRASELAQRAWLARFIPSYENGAQSLDGIPRIDTSKMDPRRLEMLTKIDSDAAKLDAMKPSETQHRFRSSVDPGTNDIRLQAQEFGNRFRGGKNIKMQLHNQRGDAFTVSGKMDTVEGKSGTVITSRQGVANKAVISVVSTGRDGPTKAESARDATILRVLQGNNKLIDQNPWIQNIWFADSPTEMTWPEEWSSAKPPPLPRQNSKKLSKDLITLNNSQRVGVNTMCSSDNDHRVVVIQGPPGTGKTSVIASYVQIATALDQKGIYLVAQSNVAVKNIAEKLIKVGFQSWKLLVSKDFRYEWNEHLYHKVDSHLIQSNDFKYNLTPGKLKDVKVILCTLSALSNNQVERLGRSNYLPLKTLIVDEASQIEIGNYLSIFDKYHRTLRKVCFIGDDKQLPPFGQESNPDLRSIFEVNHLKDSIIFLDTQYRMPPQIGQIISDAVYDGKLKSNPHHPVTDSTIACYFVDVPSIEKPLSNGSTKNDDECAAIITLARQLQEQGKNYKIITPYDGQRHAIEQRMKDEELEWGDKCFNVDSFQGNEEDYILISVVRTRAIGFLGNLRRTNVMLTRCKKGMFIFSSRKFLEGHGRETLVGKYAKETPPSGWLTVAQLDNGKFLDT